MDDNEDAERESDKMSVHTPFNRNSATTTTMMTMTTMMMMMTRYIVTQKQESETFVYFWDY